MIRALIHRHGFLTLTLVLVLGLLPTFLCYGQEEAIKARQDHLRKVLDDSCNDFQIMTNNDDSTTTGKVVFRWDNPDRGSADGCTTLWFDQEQRPIAIASVYPIQTTLHHDFDLLDRRAGAVGALKGKEFWRTKRNAKLEFKPVIGVPVPATNEKARTSQVKLIAKRFAVELLGWRRDDSDRQTLRMLPTPVHRYGSSKPDSDVALGALFLFVQGVDPEAGLLIEAHKHKSGYRWEYAFIPQTSASLTAKYNKNVVWEKDRDEVTPSHGYSAKPIPAAPPKNS